MWIGCSTAGVTVGQHTELSGFGSGEYLKGTEAQDCMTSDGRWLRFALESSDAMVILDKQRKTPDHLENASFFNKAFPTWFEIMVGLTLVDWSPMLRYP